MDRRIAGGLGPGTVIVGKVILRELCKLLGHVLQQRSGPCLLSPRPREDIVLYGMGPGLGVGGLGQFREYRLAHHLESLELPTLPYYRLEKA